LQPSNASQAHRAGSHVWLARSPTTNVPILRHPATPPFAAELGSRKGWEQRRVGQRWFGPERLGRWRVPAAWNRG
jgi:hypothetical protein